MRKISEVADRPLDWAQPGAVKKSYELRAGEERIATLQFRSLFGSLATGESADGCWTMKRVGFWHTRATVRACDSEVEIASFRDKTWSDGGTVSFPDGREYHVTTSFWKSRLAILDETGSELILITPRGLVHFEAKVEIRTGARKLKELPWLVMLGWYLTIGFHEDQAVAASAAAS